MKKLIKQAKCFAVNLPVACFYKKCNFCWLNQDPELEKSAQWKDVEAAVAARASAVNAAEASFLKAK